MAADAAKLSGSFAPKARSTSFGDPTLRLSGFTLTPDTQPLDLSVAHVDLYFFFEIDIAILALELFTDDIPLAAAQDVMFRLGRAYPAYWEPTGQAGHCPSKVEFVIARWANGRDVGLRRS